MKTTRAVLLGTMMIETPFVVEIKGFFRSPEGGLIIVQDYRKSKLSKLKPGTIVRLVQAWNGEWQLD